MIQKLQNNEYLKRIDNMDAAEREQYLKRVGEWLEQKAPVLLEKAGDEASRFQNAVQVSTMWNDAAAAAWMDGAQLLTALMGVADTWLPEKLYTKAAGRAIKQMYNALLTAGPYDIGEGRAKEDPAEGTVKATQDVAPLHGASGGRKPAGGNGAVSQLKPAAVRPKHIDQYIHLLPEKTQKKAATVQGLLRDLDVAREKMSLLMNDPHASASSREQWAKTATSLDGKLKTIYREIDAEWGKLVKEGRVTVDDLGNAHVVEHPAGEPEQEPAAAAAAKPVQESAEEPADKEAGEPEQEPAAGPAAEPVQEPAEELADKEAGEPATEAAPKKPGRKPMTDEEKARKKAEKDAAKKDENTRKAALLRKWLIDMRNAKGDEQKKKWAAKYKEMVKLGGKEAVTDKVRQAAEYYEVKI